MATTEKLIEIVRRYPIIYDLSHEDYKNIRKKDKIWDQIGLELGENGEELKKKWKNLRDSYAKHLRSLKTTTGQSAQQKLHKWQWAKQMETFRPFMSFAKTISNVTDVRGEKNADGESANIQMCGASQSPSSSKLSQEELMLDIEKDLACTEVEENSLSCETPISLPKNIRSNPSKRTKKTNETVTPTPTETVLSYLKEKQSSKTPSEGIDLIFSGYAATIKKFPPRMQINAKLKFAELMAELELQHEQEVSLTAHSNTRCSSANSTYAYTSQPSPSSIGSNHSASAQYHGTASEITNSYINASSKGTFEPHLTELQPSRFAETGNSSFMMQYHGTASRIINSCVNPGSNEETLASAEKNSPCYPVFRPLTQPIQLNPQFNQSNNVRHSVTSYFANYTPLTPFNKDCT